MKLYFQVTMLIRRLIQAFLLLFSLGLALLLPFFPVVLLAAGLAIWTCDGAVWFLTPDEKETVWAKRKRVARLVFLYLRPAWWKRCYRRLLAF